MGLLIKIALRNLLRQKRRNILLGIAIAFGMAILVVANSFSHGITDLLLNRFIVNITGHVRISVMENGNMRSSIVRDKDRFEKIIHDNLTGVKEVREGLSSFGRAVGNGKADQVALVGLDGSKDTLDYFNGSLIEGNVYDMTNRSIENPIIIYGEKAKDLNVKVGDTINFRTRTVHNQEQTARLRVVATLKASSSFEATAVYISLDSLRTMLGYRPQESAALQVIINKLSNPAQALLAADKLYKAFQPSVALEYGMVSGPTGSKEATTFGYLTNTNLVGVLTNNLKIVSGSFIRSTNTNTAMVSKKLADKLGVKTGDKITSVYRNKFGGGATTNVYKVAAVYDPGKKLGDYTVLVNENYFYPVYYENIPPDGVTMSNAYHPVTNDTVYSALAPEWKLLPRTATSEQFQKKMQDNRKAKWRGMYVDISTMYEIANFVLQLEGALNMITMIAVLILFFIILIGVVNTMRMTIRERTREIGTIRAIGMQSKDVRNTFILETFFLTLFASVTGMVFGLLIQGGLGLLTINTDSILGILLLDKHLHFVPSLVSILSNMILILIIAAFTAYFPSKRAAKMKAADALRHYE